MSNKPNNANESVVYDADKLLAEIRGQSKPFSLGGEQFDLPIPTAWPDEAMTAAASNDLPRVAAIILGDDYDRFVKAGGNSAFLQRLVVELHGADMGESSASSSS
jgi:hypothetical protein